MRVAAVVPMRSLAGGKTRLAGALDATRRAALNAALLAHALRLTARFPGPGATLLVSPDPAVLAAAREAGARPVRDPGGGLNAALALACALARGAGAERLVVLPVDLPLAAPEDVLALAAAAAPVAVAPDRRGSGTNALAVAAGLPFAPRFGPGSAAAHLAEARKSGAEAEIHRRRRLALDIDTEADWREWGRTVDREAWIEGRLVDSG